METEVTRINLLGVPIDVVPDDKLQAVIENLYELKVNRQIVLLNFHDFMKARRSQERMAALKQAALVIPVSSLLVSAARFLRKNVPPLRRGYAFIIKLLGILEQRQRSVYLLGLDSEGVLAAESALRATFPGLRIVGRYSTRFPNSRQTDILTAIKKSSPTLLLTGKGLKGKHLWLYRNHKRLAGGLSIWEQNCFGVFSGRTGKPNDTSGAHLMKGFFGALIKPWRLLRLFRYLYFFLLLLLTRLFGKR
ncbi:MAG: hypothetical protein B0D92_01975 [Spirochaeta sp. LUC14_002_19_P3]|nr:MAG: hypothetical protein B0D92_01975 [Spirochaeta sp. LUC14_002_19_P3]